MKVHFRQFCTEPLGFRWVMLFLEGDRLIQPAQLFPGHTQIIVSDRQTGVNLVEFADRA